MHCANPTTNNAKRADGKHRTSMVRLQCQRWAPVPRSFQGPLSTLSLHIQFIQVHQTVLACAPSLNCLGCGVIVMVTELVEPVLVL